MQIGAIIKQRRKAIGLTLAQLAEASSVSAAMLSEIERDLKNPTVRTLDLIARGLGCPITDLLAAQGRSRVEVVRQGDRNPLVDPASGMRYTVLTNALHGRGVFLAKFVVPPHTETKMVPAEPNGMVKVSIVTRGRMVTVVGAEEVEHSVGDTVCFVADVPHCAVNRWDEEAEFIVVGHSPVVEAGGGTATLEGAGGG